MGIGEKGATGGQAVDVRGESVWVAIKAADPIVLIIDGDEEDIWLGLSLISKKRPRSENHPEEKDAHDFSMTDGLHEVDQLSLLARLGPRLWISRGEEWGGRGGGEETVGSSFSGSLSENYRS